MPKESMERETIAANLRKRPERMLPQIAHEVCRYYYSGDQVLTPEMVAYDLQTLRVAVECWRAPIFPAQAAFDAAVLELIKAALKMVEERVR